MRRSEKEWAPEGGIRPRKGSHMELMSGNEAIAQGAWEAGARIGTAYPGTPSTETMEAFAKKDGV